MKNIFLITLIMGALGLAGISGCTPADIQALQGTLQNIDSVSGNITVKLKDGTTQSFNLTDVKVETIRQALGNASLEIGDHVTVKAHKTGKVEGLEVERAEIGGVIKSLGTGDVTITTKKQGDITLGIKPDTTIRIGEKGSANFSALKVGQRIEVKYDVNSKMAIRINVNAEESQGEISGRITAVDSVNLTVTVNSTKGVVVLKVTPNTTIKIEDKGTATLADLKTGQKIEAKYEAATLIATRLSVEDTHAEQEKHSQNETARDGQGKETKERER